MSFSFFSPLIFCSVSFFSFGNLGRCLYRARRGRRGWRWLRRNPKKICNDTMRAVLLSRSGYTDTPTRDRRNRRPPFYRADRTRDLGTSPAAERLPHLLLRLALSLLFLVVTISTNQGRRRRRRRGDGGGGRGRARRRLEMKTLRGKRRRRRRRGRLDAWFGR